MTLDSSQIQTLVNFLTDLFNALQGDTSALEKIASQGASQLTNAGIDITMEDLLKDNNDAVITRAHFAKHLVAAGVVKTKGLEYKSPLPFDEIIYYEA